MNSSQHSQAMDPKPFDLKSLVNLAKKHWLVIFTLTVLCSLLALYFALKAKPVYQSSASLMIERPNRMMSLEEIYGMAGTNWEFYPNQIHLLQSVPVAQRVVKQIGAERFLESNIQPKWYEALIRGKTQKSPSEMTAQEKNQKALSNVRSTLSISQEKGSGVFLISFDDYDPELAAMKANALAESYIEEVLEAGIKAKQRTGQSLSSQLPELEKKVKESELKLKEFQKNQQILIPDGDDDLYVQELSSINERISDLKRRKLGLESVYNRIKSVNNSPQQLARIPDLLEKSEVQSIRQRYVSSQNRVSELAQVYGPKHPKMKQAMEAEKIAENEYFSILRTTADLLVADYNSISRELALDESSLTNLKSKMTDQNELVFEYEALKRDYEYNQQIYSAFLKQLKETDAVKSGNVQSINARVVNYAVPAGYPYKPNKKLILLFGIFAGLLLGSAVAFLLEHFDNTFKSNDEVESKLNLPVIGMLPDINQKDSSISPALQFIESPKSAFAESIRTLRTGVLLSMADKDHKSFLVTSTVPSEGKTTIALNLAHSLSHLGETILVEADLRRPMVKKTLGDDNRIGLSSMISGECTYAECVSNGKRIKNLHILSSGPIPPNPLELLSSDKFDKLLDQLKKKYKFVVVDCAPVMAVSDALTLSQKVDGVLFVIKNESTPSQMAEAAVTRLSRVGAKIIGVAMNRLKTNKAKYGRYYKYEGNYYGHYGYHLNEKENQRKA